MTDAERAFLSELAQTIEYWSSLIVKEAEKKEPEFPWAARSDSLRAVTAALKHQGLEKELGHFATELLYGFAHSILVSLDGGSKLADQFPLRITTSDGTPLCKYLHELLPDIRAEMEALGGSN